MQTIQHIKRRARVHNTSDLHLPHLNRLLKRTILLDDPQHTFQRRRHHDLRDLHLLLVLCAGERAVVVLAPVHHQDLVAERAESVGVPQHRVAVLHLIVLADEVPELDAVAQQPSGFDTGGGILG